jgi:putative ATPase
MRPRVLEEFIGQEHIVGHGRLLRRAIQADQLSSVIFFGPPGTGKTTLAMIIANTTESHFITINAVLAGVAQIREAIKEAKELRNLYNQRATLFIDEVHRWNKAQQDALLPHVENGTIIMIGATTENPYFEVNKALVSRSRIFQLKALTLEDLYQIADQAINDQERGYGQLNLDIRTNAIDHLVDVANGDARGVLNALELAVETTLPNQDGIVVVDLAVAEESIQRRAVLYDKEGDVHYDTISAFIKSLRGSDPDAALYWMAKMVYAGEEPRFIFRRMAILASEDVGLADPQAATVVAGCWDLFERVGMPEGRFHLSQAALYLATCPKSNSTLAFFDALSTVEGEQEAEVPTHLRDGNRDSEGFGHGKGYLYPHAYRDHWVSQQYLPDSLQGKAFYEPGDQGYEKEIALRVARQREAQLAAMVERETTFPETFTTGIQDRARDAWLQRAISDSGRQLGAIRDRLFETAKVQRHHLVLDLNAGSGLLTWEAVRQAPEGGVWALAQDQKTGEGLRQMALRLPEIERPVILIGNLDELDKMFHLRGEDEIQFDRILGRNGFTKSNNRGLLMEQIVAKFQPDGKLCLAQVIPSLGQRLYQLFDWTKQDQALCQELQRAEEEIYQDPDDPLVNWNIESFEKDLVDAGFSEVEIVMDAQIERRTITTSHLDRWFGPQNEKANRAKAATVTDTSAEINRQDADTGTYRHKLATAGMEPEAIEQVSRIYRSELNNQSVSWNISRAYIIARR